MITRFYVDNYKCLQDFEYRPKQLELILGANGAGKTTVFEALDKVCQFILGEKKIGELFDFGSTTRWDPQFDLNFELDMDDDGRKFSYSLSIGFFALDNEESSITEKLSIGDKIVVEAVTKEPPYELNLQDSAIYREVELTIGNSVRTFPASNPSFSVMGMGMGQGFQYAVEKIMQFRINPDSMSYAMIKEDKRPNRSFKNFPAYYTYALQEKQRSTFNLMNELRSALPGFDQFSLQNFNERRVLFAVMDQPKRNTRYRFDELSDGQRMLICLYTLLNCSLEKDVTLIIDEPENYIALRELQPWLMLLEEKIEEEGGQVILISHHPEFINMLAPERSIVFERKNGGKVTVRDFDTSSAKTLAPAEAIARGWEVNE